MIKNKRQYAATAKQVQLFKEALARWSADDMPVGFDPRMHQAQRDGFESQLESLQNQLTEFDALQNGCIEAISLKSLDELPVGLIKARIARGLTQKELAEKVGVKTQQVQRWEAEDYENVNFSSMIDIAHALELDISETIRLPAKHRPAFSALKDLGITKAFINARLVPTKLKWLNPDMDKAELLAAAADRLDKIFGCKIATDGTVANDDRFLLVASEGRFKIPADATANKVTAYAVYAKHLAEIVARATADLSIYAIPRDWKALRTALLGDAPMSFERLLNGAWDMGIPVLPLADPIRFHGVCWRIHGRNVVVLKQPMSFESRWAFDLVHEIYHAGENPELDSMAAVQCDPMDETRRESDDEANANNMAGNVLLNGLAEELYQKIITAAGNKWQLIPVAQQVAKDADVNIGHLANYLAFRLNADSFIEWWGPAAMLQPETDPPFETAKKVFFERVNLAELSAEDRDLLEQALSDPEIS